MSQAASGGLASVSHSPQLSLSSPRKHIVSPSSLVPEDRPLALVAWGCRLTMAHVDEQEVGRSRKELD